MKRPGYLGNADSIKPRASREEAVKQAIQSTAAPGASEARRAEPVEARRDASPEKTKEKELRAKEAEKTGFPPGLVVSEQAKNKMQEKRATTEAARLAKEQKKAKWQQRPEVSQRFQQINEKFLAKKQALLAKWEAHDEKKRLHRAQLLAALDANAAQQKKLEFAQEDTVEALTRTDEVAKLEVEEVKEVEKQERAQVGRDKRYNFIAGIFGWQKRTIPN